MCLHSRIADTAGNDRIFIMGEACANSGVWNSMTGGPKE